MGKYRKNLSGDLAYYSFVPIPVSKIHVTHNQALDQSLDRLEVIMRKLDAATSQLGEERIRSLVARESEYSCKLALGEPSISFGFMSGMGTDNGLVEDSENLLKATYYAFGAMGEELPLSGRLLKNAHYLMCQGERYAKKYPGEFRISPVWIGWKTEKLDNALFVPPVNEDMIEAFSDLEYYINYEESEHVFVRAALIHYQFEMIHPFVDANGRVGRLLNSLFLSQQGILRRPILSFSKILYQRAAVYYKELQSVNETANYDGWLDFYLKALEKAAENTLRDLNGVKNQDRDLAFDLYDNAN